MIRLRIAASQLTDGNATGVHAAITVTVDAPFDRDQCMETVKTIAVAAKRHLEQQTPKNIDENPENFNAE